jgi:3-deoxy-manno-octulosonate cytidylyltransferase (CMP-KDO synthetase)
MTGEPVASRGGTGALAIVPARLGSERLPRKVLLRETGAYLFEHTVRNAERAPAVERVVLATDSEEVVRAANEVDVEALLTSPDHPSGTDRIREALDALLEREGACFPVVVNVQADEPELSPDDLGALVSALDDPEVEIATLAAPAAPGEADAPSAVKVVVDAAGDALYFSRSRIPSATHRREDAPEVPVLRHVGVYAFRPDALAAFCDLPTSRLEAAESLEQLRWLEAGRSIRVVVVDAAPAGIDTAEDYRAFVERTDARSR